MYDLTTWTTNDIAIVSGIIFGAIGMCVALLHWVWDEIRQAKRRQHHLYWAREQEAERRAEAKYQSKNMEQAA